MSLRVQHEEKFKKGNDFLEQAIKDKKDPKDEKFGEELKKVMEETMGKEPPTETVGELFGRMAETKGENDEGILAEFKKTNEDEQYLTYQFLKFLVKYQTIIAPDSQELKEQTTWLARLDEVKTFKD